ncbi:hypothetical protein KC640_03465 [Candidatus Dojkabacteria bacterium]|uniref:Uncharacterized protein n=1 Tax=Candidatus Dojkabacteria bacterium TaxID=2099670 RepID=A0A955I6D9_9BACT|nr:hypothetical protein [Candidatus Dojkabacteria bacterium]
MQIYTLNIRKQVVVDNTNRLAKYIQSVCEQLHLRGQVIVSAQSVTVNLEGSNELLTKVSAYLQEEIPLLEDECDISPSSVSLANGLEVKEVDSNHSAFSADPAATGGNLS